MKPVTALCLAVPVLLCAGRAWGQDQPPVPAAAPAPAAAVQPETQADLPVDIDAALARARAAYRTGPVAEQVSIHLKYADGRERASVVTLRLDAGGADRPRRLYLDLGRIVIAADDHAVTAISPQESSLLYQSPINPPLTLAQLWDVVPPVQLPQLVWAFSRDDAVGDLTASILQVSWIKTQFTREQGAVFSGVSPGGAATAAFTKAGRLISLGLPILKDGTRLEMTVLPLDAGEGAWTIPTEGRRTVASITELRPKPAPVAPGARLPALGLMTRDMEPYSLPDELAATATGDAAHRTPVALVVAYRGASPEALRDAQAGARAVASVRPHVLSELADASLMPRFVVCAAAFLDLGDVNRTRLAAIDAPWDTDADIVGIRRVYSPTGTATLDRLARGALAAVLVLDGDQKILAAIPLDGRAHDDGGVTRDLVAAIAGAVRTP